LRWNWNSAAPNSLWFWDPASATRRKKSTDVDEPPEDLPSPARQRRSDRHERLITDILRTGYRRCPREWLRGVDRQRGERSLERQVRVHALGCARWATRCGWGRGRIARALGIDSDTLATWQQRFADPADRLRAKPLGAPALVASPVQRRDVLDFLALHGTALGVDVLKDHFPLLAKRDLACLLTFARQEAHDALRGGYIRALTWNGAGRVWALDFTEPPSPVEGRYRYVLTVRDLASGCTLAAIAVRAEDAQAAIHVLAALFAAHGPPLVLKADNGPAFIARDTRAFLEHHGVQLLLSPAYTPSYNGACEAGNGTIKTLAHELACRHGRPTAWTLDDLEGARLWANRRITDRMQIHNPEQRFAVRQAITSSEREQFHHACRGARVRRCADLAVAPGQSLRTIAADALARQAIADAHKGTGVLEIRSQRVRLSNPIADHR
jgi:transposase InsO family protein